MSLEELWELFPIFLVKPDKSWKSDYQEMESRLKTTLSGRRIVRISHIGSTAIDGIWAKDIVDILVEAAEEENLADIAGIIVDMGFTQMSAADRRFSFNWGYTESGFADRVYHLHLRYAGDNDELYFRDYMNAHPAAAREYEALKLSLWKRYEHDRDGYTNAKTDLIRKYTQSAKEEYAGRY